MRDPEWNENTVVYYGIDEIKIAYSSDDPKKITQCDFDESDCTVNLGSLDETIVRLRNSLETSNKTITDVSSTSNSFYSFSKNLKT